MAETKEMSFPITNSVTLKVGKGFKVEDDGTLSINLAVAGNTLSEPGIAIFSANQFTVNANGMVQVKTATYSTNGICSFDSASFVITSTGRVQMKGATTASRGVVQLATDAEIAAGTDANKVVTPASLAKRLKEYKPEGATSKPTTLIGGGDTNEYPLNNGGLGMIAVWDAKSKTWIPSAILQQIVAVLDYIGSKDSGVARTLADKIQPRSYNHTPSSIDNANR